MPTTRPTQGQIYVSRKDPAFRVCIETISEPEDDGFFLVEICRPEDIGDMGAMGHELDHREWHNLVSEYELNPEA